tara:strand:+ start:3840 stop:4673 length:834 start_codon:yes stop_codon:yes gene_type:complete
MSGSKLKLRKFDIKSIPSDKVIVFIGKRETGKSFLVKDLLYYHKDVPIGTVISGTEAANTFYGNMVPSLFIHDAFTPQIVANSLKRQKMVIKKINKDKARYGSSNIDPRAFLILDDCLYDQSWVRDENIRNLFMNGRHYKMLFIITMQYALGVPPNLRTNIDYVFILRENLMNNRKRLYEHYAGMFPSFEIFCQVMDACTEDFNCLVINNNAKSNKIEDQVFWYKADPHSEFKIGASEFWKHHNNNYNDGYDTDEDDSNFAPPRKKGPIVDVIKTNY